MNRTVWPLVFGLGVLACGPDPVVGGTCRAGLTECNGKCVDLITDRNHCGTCDTVCTTDRTCFSGTCLTDDEIDKLNHEGGNRDGGGFGGAEYSDAADATARAGDDASAGGAGTGAGAASGDGGGAGGDALNSDASAGAFGSDGSSGASGSAGSLSSAGSSGPIAAISRTTSRRIWMSWSRSVT